MFENAVSKADLQRLLKKESRVPVFPPWERCLFDWGPDWPLAFVFPREDWAVSSPPTLKGAGEEEDMVDEEAEMFAEPVDEESDFWRSRAK